MEYRARDGVKLYFETAGQGAPPILFVHGWTCNHTHFAPQAEHFSRRHRTVSVDLRGHGQSDKPEQEYSIAGFADDLAWLCGELRLQKPIVVGHSMGGMIAVELAARHPELPSAIVACDAPLLLPAVLSGNITAMRERFRGTDWQTTLRGFIETMFIPADDPERKQRIIEQMFSTPRHVMLSCWDAIIASDTAASVSACKVPFMFIGATNPPADIPRLRQLCPTAVIAQTAGAGHFSQLEVPEQVNAMIERFLKASGITSA